ncbi:hypothetical protein Tco_0069130, partial [Tanacetum coccineum]
VMDVEKNDTMAPNADDAINKELVNLISLDKFNVGVACLSLMVSVAAVWWNFHVMKSHKKVMLQVKIEGNLLFGCLYRSFVMIRDCLGVFWYMNSCFAIMGWSSSLFVDYIANMECLEEHGRDFILIGPSVIIMWLGSFLKINGSVEQEYNFEDIASGLWLNDSHDFYILSIVCIDKLVSIMVGNAFGSHKVEWAFYVLKYNKGLFIITLDGKISIFGLRIGLEKKVG